MILPIFTIHLFKGDKFSLPYRSKGLDNLIFDYCVTLKNFILAKNKFVKIIIYNIFKYCSTYQPETWTLAATNKKHLGRFNRKVLRRIIEPVQEGEVWRKIKNQKLIHFRLREQRHSEMEEKNTDSDVARNFERGVKLE